MSSDLPLIRAITTGPKFHWFGYYDKLQFDPTGRYVLGMEVDFEHRSPTHKDVIRVGMVDLQDQDRWIELGTSSAWCWQQGCMLQWRPGSTDEVVWNDREDGQYVCHILNVRTGQKRTVESPIYSISPDGRYAVAPDFRRIADTRPGYGYNGIPDPNKDVLAPEDTGIWHIDLETGTSKLIIPLSSMLDIPWAHGGVSGMKHWFNHLLWNPDGTRFEFLNRWYGEAVRGLPTRMMTAKPDGSDIRVLDDFGHTSHFIWRDTNSILAWSWHPTHGGAFYLYFEDGCDPEVVGENIMVENGHCTYLPGNEWILNDTYPDKNRQQQPYLYHVQDHQRYPLGHFFTGEDYMGEWRCDLHPRFSPNGKLVTIDLNHEGNGRQIYLIDISQITKK